MALALALPAVPACDEDAPTEDPGAADTSANGDGADAADSRPCASFQLVDIGGIATLHPLTELLDPTADLVGAQVLLRDPILAFTGKDSTLQTADCATASAPLEAPAAGQPVTWRFDDVDTSRLSIGLMVTIDDPADVLAADPDNPADPLPTDEKWVRASHGVAPGTVPIDVLEGTAMGLSLAALEAAAPLLPADDGAPRTAADIAAMGFLAGWFIDADGDPLAGVSLVDLDGVPVEGAVYPNATWDGVQADGRTADHGLFFIVQAPLKSYTGEAPGYVFPEQQAASSVGGAFLLTLVAEP